MGLKSLGKIFEYEPADDEGRSVHVAPQPGSLELILGFVDKASNELPTGIDWVAVGTVLIAMGASQVPREQLYQELLKCASDMSSQLAREIVKSYEKPGDTPQENRNEH